MCDKMFHVVLRPLATDMREGSLMRSDELESSPRLTGTQLGGS